MKKQFRYYILGALILFVALFIYGCGSGAAGGGGSSGGGGASMIKLTGQVAGYSISSFGSHISDISDVKKVVIINCYGGHWVANVSNGVFTGEAEAGRPVGLIFAGASDEFLGYLTMGSSIDSIPLNLVDSITTAIDLQTIRCKAGVATSENDFIGSAESVGKISNADVATMSFGNELFSSIIKNPDANGDGTIDIIETNPKYYRPYFLYFVTAGNFTGTGDGDYTPVATSTLITQYRFNLDAYESDVSLPANISIKAPSVTHLCSFDASNTTNSTSRHLYYTQAVNGTPEAGTFEVTGLSSTLSFEVSARAIATDHIAIAKPTVTVFEGKVTQISWTYYDGATGSALIAPESLVEVAAIQIDDNSNSTDSRIYDTELTMGPSVKSHIFKSQYMKKGLAQITWSSVESISMAYKDVFGNQVVVKWTKP